jgi:hypothetical protein
MASSPVSCSLFDTLNDHHDQRVTRKRRLERLHSPVSLPAHAPATPAQRALLHNSSRCDYSPLRGSSAYNSVESLVSLNGTPPTCNISARSSPFRNPLLDRVKPLAVPTSMSPPLKMSLDVLNMSGLQIMPTEEQQLQQHRQIQQRHPLGSVNNNQPRPTVQRDFMLLQQPQQSPKAQLSAAVSSTERTVLAIGRSKGWTRTFEHFETVRDIMYVC